MLRDQALLSNVLTCLDRARAILRASSIEDVERRNGVTSLLSLSFPDDDGTIMNMLAAGAPSAAILNALLLFRCEGESRLNDESLRALMQVMMSSESMEILSKGMRYVWVSFRDDPFRLSHMLSTQRDAIVTLLKKALQFPGRARAFACSILALACEDASLASMLRKQQEILPYIVVAIDDSECAYEALDAMTKSDDASHFDVHSRGVVRMCLERMLLQLNPPSPCTMSFLSTVLTQYEDALADNLQLILHVLPRMPSGEFKDEIWQGVMANLL
jgi:hypothetical protein